MFSTKQVATKGRRLLPTTQDAGYAQGTTQESQAWWSDSPDALSLHSPRKDSRLCSSSFGMKQINSSPVPKSNHVARSKRPPVYSFKRKRLLSKRLSAPSTPSRTVFATISENKRKKKLLARKTSKLVQSQIDLGNDVRTTCKLCGMDYVLVNSDDIALHKKFHVMNVGGVSCGKVFSQVPDTMRLWNGCTEEVAPGFIIAVDRSSSMSSKNATRRVLEVANKDLSAVEIKDERLWGRTGSVDTSRVRSQRNADQIRDEGIVLDHAKTFLYIHEEKCIGLCLVERISEANKVLPQDDSQDLNLSSSSSITASSKTEPAIIGVLRLWTSRLHRRKGIASRLLDCATKNFIYGMSVSKEQVAFSQPTESGGQLARAWSGREKKWMVYSEN